MAIETLCSIQNCSGLQTANANKFLCLDKKIKANYNKFMIQGLKSDRYLHSILDALSGLDIRKVILFGSYVKGLVSDESDIDLLIVLDDNTLPENYDEWLEIKMKVRRALRDINNSIAIDLLVYTKPQYDQILQDMNSFHKEIHETGKIIYEKAG